MINLKKICEKEKMGTMDVFLKLMNTDEFCLKGTWISVPDLMTINPKSVLTFDLNPHALTFQRWQKDSQEITKLV